MIEGNVKFNLGDIVYHRIGDNKGIVTGIVFRPGSVMYLITWQNLDEKWHHDIEFSTDQILKSE